ncbi:hypothetical protein D3C83_13500 [compost metagenome]
MALFGSVSSSQVDDFAKSLVQELSKEYPPTREQGEKKYSEKRIFSALDRIFGKARNFGREHRLGVYKKAKLANTFRWELQEMGYSAKFIEFATEGLVVSMTRKD